MTEVFPVARARGGRSFRRSERHPSCRSPHRLGNPPSSEERANGARWKRSRHPRSESAVQRGRSFHGREAGLRLRSSRIIWLKASTSEGSLASNGANSLTGGFSLGIQISRSGSLCGSTTFAITPVYRIRIPRNLPPPHRPLRPPHWAARRSRLTGGIAGRCRKRLVPRVSGVCRLGARQDLRRILVL